MLTSAAKIRTPEITATTIPATTPASRPLLEIPVPGFCVVASVKYSETLKTMCLSNLRLLQSVYSQLIFKSLDMI